MDKKQPIFADGLMWKRPNDKTKEKAPWVKGHMSINVAKLMKWMLVHQQGDWLNLDLKESKDKTKLYFELNTYGRKEDTVLGQPDVDDIPLPTEEMMSVEYNDF